ncbi:MAG TPA: hypothetical protein VFU09_03110 [Candidatus Udaeobacter sp.]|jgi:hypothetical protein|nr:hypothetical protein [Candidatus Udaeobacter sp.]
MTIVSICRDTLFYGHWGPGAKFHDGTLEVFRKGSLPSLCPLRLIMMA